MREMAGFSCSEAGAAETEADRIGAFLLLLASELRNRREMELRGKDAAATDDDDDDDDGGEQLGTARRRGGQFTAAAENAICELERERGGRER